MKIEKVSSEFEKSLNIDSNLRFSVADIYYHGTWKKSGWPAEATNALLAENNKYDIYMWVLVNHSDIYSDKKSKPLGYEMQCIAHCTEIDNNTTKVEIKVLKAQAHIRNQILPSPPHFENNPVYKKVKPTTIEEYEILQCFGKYLGVIDQMPKLKI